MSKNTYNFLGQLFLRRCKRAQDSPISVTLNDLSSNNGSKRFLSPEYVIGQNLVLRNWPSTVLVRVTIVVDTNDNGKSEKKEQKTRTLRRQMGREMFTQPGSMLVSLLFTSIMPVCLHLRSPMNYSSAIEGAQLHVEETFCPLVVVSVSTYWLTADTNRSKDD